MTLIFNLRGSVGDPGQQVLHGVGILCGLIWAVILTVCQTKRRKRLARKIENSDSCQRLYSLVSVLRVLLLKNAGGIKWDIIKNMMDHKEARYKEEKVVEGVKMATNFFREKFGLDWATSENVQHSSGVLKTNAICFMDRGGQALYPIVSLLSHSCVANLELVRDPAASITFRAKRKIKKEED